MCLNHLEVTDGNILDFLKLVFHYDIFRLTQSGELWVYFAFFRVKENFEVAKKILKAAFDQRQFLK
jgi:hypothetical protein